MGLQGMINDLVERCDTAVPDLHLAKGKSLENELGVKLFLRNSDGISLTKAGMRLSSSVQVLASDISKTHNQILEDMDVPSGRLNVTATNAFGALWVAPRMSKFKSLYSFSF